MKPWWSAMLLAIALPAAAATRDATAACPVPDHFAMHGLSLPATAARLRGEHRMVVLALGSSSTAGAAAGDPAATYPARLQRWLEAALPGTSISVVNRGAPHRTAEEMVEHLPADLINSGANLVLWEAGAPEAALTSDIEPFIAALESGFHQVRAAGADLILLDMQYAPSIARVVNTEPYQDAIRGVAGANDLAIFPRYDLMMFWNEKGEIDLDAQQAAERIVVARHLFDCIAAALAAAIVEAVR
jgi:hypothetical protein